MRKIYILPILLIVLAIQPVDAGFISGMKFDDANENGIFDILELGEFKIAYWSIEAYDQNWNLVKSFDTGSTGIYEIELSPGRYFIKEVQKGEWYRTLPETYYTVDILDGSSIGNIDFGNGGSTKGGLSGISFNDSDGDGIKDLNEGGIAGWTIVLQRPDGTEVATTTTDQYGYYEFRNLDYGSYRIMEIIGQYWKQTYPQNPNFYDVAIDSVNSYVDHDDFGNTEECHCIQLDIRPKTTKQRGGNEISYDARGKVNASDKSSVDVELDVDWVIRMTCALKPGTCKATLSPTVSSSWSIDGIPSNANGEGITSSPIDCNGICDNSGHTTRNPPQDVKSTYKATIQKGDGNFVTTRIDGTITVTMKATDCPGSWTAKLVYVGISGHKPKIDWPTSDYDNDGKLNKNDKFPLDPTK